MHLHLGFDSEGMNEDLGIHHIVVNDWKRGVDADQNVVLISVPSVFSPALAPPGKHVLHAYTPGTEPFGLWEGLDRKSSEYKKLKDELSELQVSKQEKVNKEKADMELTHMSKNHVLTYLTPLTSKISSSSSTTYTPLSHTSSLHPITSKNNANPTTTITKNKPNRVPKNEPKITIPTMRDILASSKQQKVELRLQTLGPFFRITAKRLASEEEIGRAEGIIRVWFGGKILHLDSIKLSRETLGMDRSIFGIGVFLGAVAIRYGYDCGCTCAQLLAINDSDLYHKKLVRFYTRIGFKKVYEVTGSSIGDYSHMLVWGGVGTRMEANVEHLLVKWCTRFIPTQ